MTWPVFAAWSLWAAVVGTTGLSLLMQVGHEMVYGGLFDIAEAVTLVVFTTTGLLITRRQPENTVGWLLLLIPLAVGIERLAGAYVVVQVDSQPADLVGRVALWMAGTSWLSGLAVVLLVGYLPLLYPNGRLPSPRWKVAAWLTAIVAAVEVIGSSLSAAEFDPPFTAMSNPFALWSGDGLDAFGSVVLLLAIPLLSATAVVVRFRRSRGLERQQMKWFTLAVAVVVAALLISGMQPIVAPTVSSELTGALTFLPAIMLLPVSIGIAIFRYRLYEIDRLVSRTVSYGLLTAVLVSVYVGLVFLLGAVLPSDSPLAVVASTLAAASMFSPVRRWIQEVVDRRFYRARYDAASISERFSGRLRNEVDPEALTEDLLTAVAGAIQPSHMSLWLWEEE